MTDREPLSDCPACESSYICQHGEGCIVDEAIKNAGVPLVKGPTTFTAACSCDSQLPGYHRMDCGVYD